MISQERLEAILRTLPRLTIGLVGDLFLDRYLHLVTGSGVPGSSVPGSSVPGSSVPGSSELSIETGLEAYQIDHVRNSPGALGTVMNNLAALGVGLLVPVTAIGDDGHGYDLLREVRKLPVDPSQVLCLPDRLTPTYTKPLRQDAGGQWHELNRLDVRTRGPLTRAATELLCHRVEQVFRSSDGLIVLDQLVDEDCGVVNFEVRGTLERLAAEQPEKFIYVDSRRFLGKFNFGVLKGNRSEVLGSAVGNALRGVSSAGIDDRSADHGTPETAFPTADNRAVCESLIALAHKTGRAAYCTLGERGILVAKPGHEPTLMAGTPVKGRIDIVGAGDAATSGIVTALLAGANELEAAALGNLVASITIQQLGTTGTASPEQVRARWAAVDGPVT